MTSIDAAMALLRTGPHEALDDPRLSDEFAPLQSAARVRAVAGAAASVALLMLVYEWLKTALWPTLTIWESHTITIGFSTTVAAFATWVAMRQSERLHERLRRAEARRAQAHERSRQIAERAEDLERMNGLLAKEISERRAVEAQLVQSQKMESVGRLAGGIAHDFNNLLSVIIAGVDLATAQVVDRHDPRGELDAIREASLRASRLTRQLLTFARHQPHEPRPTDVHALILAALPVVRRLVGETIDVEVLLLAERRFARVDPGQFEQVLFNLSLNAADAMPRGGRITVAVRDGLRPPAAEAGDGGTLIVEIADTGHGIPDDVLPRLFEPFFTTKPVGKGTGLGLATSYGIITRCGGSIEARNQDGGGAIFRVTLPADPTADALPTVAVDHVVETGPGTVLLVEDEPAVRDIARRVLEMHGYRVLSADDGEQALAVAAEHGQSVDLLLTDVVMPRLGGRALAQAVRARRPGLPVLFMSGYTDGALIGEGIADAHFLQKPFSAAGLVARVATAIAAGQAA